MNKGVALAFDCCCNRSCRSILYGTRNNRLELQGDILKVRSHEIDDANTVAVLDFRLTNPSTQQFVVKEVEVFVDDTSADIFPEIDAQRLFQYYPDLGQKYNSSLIRRDKIDPGAQVDRMIAIRVGGKDESFQRRKRLRLVVQDADGAKREIVKLHAE
ncbi:MAG: hypothetical protein WKF37_13890 [Bryobacteraceae bacterium]